VRATGPGDEALPPGGSHRDDGLEIVLGSNFTPGDACGSAWHACAVEIDDDVATAEREGLIRTNGCAARLACGADEPFGARLGVSSELAAGKERRPG
jgi:hypothetical protein